MVVRAADGLRSALERVVLFLRLLKEAIPATDGVIAADRQSGIRWSARRRKNHFCEKEKESFWICKLGF